jgi:hypothetical protein
MKTLILISLALAATIATWGAPAHAAPPDIPQSYLIGPSGTLAPLQARLSYGAGQFPIPLRVTPPDGSWWGAEWKSGDQYFAGGAPPNFGWVHLAHADSPTSIPNGMITITTAYGPTPSVAATVNVLLSRGRGATYGPTSPVTLAGFTGVQFDGRIVGVRNIDHIGHYFVPFSPKSKAAKYYPDEYPVYGDVFHVLVLDVRGKTVIVYVENVGLPAEKFSAFLVKANRILDTLRFPKG